MKKFPLQIRKDLHVALQMQRIQQIPPLLAVVLPIYEFQQKSGKI